MNRSYVYSWNMRTDWGDPAARYQPSKESSLLLTGGRLGDTIRIGWDRGILCSKQGQMVLLSFLLLKVKPSDKNPVLHWVWWKNNEYCYAENKKIKIKKIQCSPPPDFKNSERWWSFNWEKCPFYEHEEWNIFPKQVNQVPKDLSDNKGRRKISRQS